MDAVEGADAVVNLSGVKVVDPFKPWTRRYRDAVLRSRVDSTTALVDAIRRAERRPSVMVNQSAIGFYGSQGDRVLTEFSPPGSDFLADVVQAWEAAARPAEDLGVRLVLLRTAVVLGRGGGLLPQFRLPFKLFFGGTMGRPDQWFSWIHLDDEVGVFIHALTHQDVSGPVNSAAPNPVTMRDFSRSLGHALKRPTWIPLVWLGMKIFLGRRSEAVLASQRVQPEILISHGYRFKYPEVEAALRDSV
jgi:uncharacterized protein (TIGR01777 family)